MVVLAPPLKMSSSEANRSSGTAMEANKPKDSPPSVWSDPRAADVLIRIGLAAGNRLDVDEPLLTMPAMPDQKPQATE